MNTQSRRFNALKWPGGRAASFAVVAVIMAVGSKFGGFARGLKSQEDAEKRREELLKRPLIVGASVSANYGTDSPGRRLALRSTTADQIRTIAQGGAPGRIMFQLVTRQVLKDRSVILSIDGLFWDSTLPDPQESLRAFKDLVNRVAEQGLWLVIGDIPELLPGRQEARRVLNEEIHAVCLSSGHCRVVGLERIHREALRDGYLEIKGRRYTLTELVPDGLHLSEPAADFLADQILKTLQE